MASQEMLNALSEEDPSTFRRALNYVKGLRGSGAPLAASANEAMMTALGPQGRKAVAPVAGLANVFSLGADVRDAMEFSGDTLESLKAGDFGKAGSDALYTAAAPFAMLLPGSLGGYKRATDAAVGAVGDALDTAPTRFQNPQIFAGQNAVGAPLDKLDEAKKLEETGEAAETVWGATGWFRGQDGKWRFEIDDSAAVVNPISKKGETSLSAAISHPELFAAYPDLSNVPVKLRNNAVLGSSYTPSTDKIKIGEYVGPDGLSVKDRALKINEDLTAINDKIRNVAAQAGGNIKVDTPEYYEYMRLLQEFRDTKRLGKQTLGTEATPEKSVLLHEIQHAIQNPRREDFASGGSPSSIPPGLRPRGLSKRETYNRLAGEVEARNVEKRTDLTAAERADLPPRLTEDYDASDQIVNFRPEQSYMESVAESYPIATVGDNMAPPSMYDLPAGSDPRYLGAAPDRNQFSLLRYRPKSETPRVQASIKAISDPENPMRQQLEADIDRGLDVGGADWYNTEELRDWFVKELGEEQGNLEWAQFIDLVGSTSPGSKVPSNIKNASAMRQRLYNDPEYRDLLEGVSNIDEARDIARGRVPGYGHKTQGLQEQILSKQQAGRWSGDPEPGVAPSKGSSTENPKPKGFSWSLKGSSQNIAADLHFTRYVAMASRDPRWLTTQAEIGAADAERLLALSPKKLGKYFGSRKVDGKTLRTFNAKKAVKEGVLDVDQVADLGLPAMWSEKPNTNEYRALEKLMYDIGEQRGLTAPQIQAALWMGAADRTGVDVSSQKTFMEAFRSVADRRAKAESMTREEVIQRFIRDKGLLALPAIGVLGAGAAAVPQDDTDMVSALRGA